jgi:hypothetical protein
MDPQEELNKVLAQKIFYTFDSKILVDWAVMMMQNGLESESLIILAGLDNESTEEREQYFLRAIEELKLDNSKSENDLLDYYATYVAESVINKKIKPLDGLTLMLNIVLATDYSDKYIQFYYINEDLDYLQNYQPAIFSSGLSLENKENYILKEFELLLESNKYKIDNKIRELAFCNICQTINKSILRTKRNWIGQKKYDIWVCGNCGSNDILSFNNQKGKEIILNKIKNAT